MRAGIEFIDLFAKLGAPLGDGDSEINIKRQSGQSDDGIPLVKLHAQNTEHQHHFNQSRHYAVERIRDQRLYASDTAFNVAAHAASLALQVKTQTQIVQMLKGLQCNFACSALCGRRKHQFTQFGKARHRQTQQPVTDQQGQRHHQSNLSAGWLWRHGVNQFLEQQRHADVGQLGADHERERRHDPPFVFPQVGKQLS